MTLSSRASAGVCCGRVASVLTAVALLMAFVPATAGQPTFEEQMLRAVLSAENPREAYRQVASCEKATADDIQRVLAFDAPRSALRSQGRQGTSQANAEDDFWAEGFQDPSGSTGTDGIVWSFQEFNGDLILGGDFSTTGGIPANNIARWDGSSWNAMGSGFDGAVFALAVYDGALIAAGDFTTAGDTSVHYIARWDGGGWEDLGGGLSGPVRALVEYDGNLIVGGDFGQAGGTAAAQIAQWDGLAWSPVGGGFAGGPGGLGVRALTIYDGALVAGGFFRSAEGRPMNHIARWDGTAWQPIGTWTDDTVYSLIVHDNELVAGAVVWHVGWGTWEDMILRFDGTSWVPMGSGSLDNPFPNAVRALTVYEGDLVAAGQFPRAGGSVVKFIARWSNGSWTPLDAGTDNNIFALAVFNGDLVAGGEFLTAGEQNVGHIARWDGTDWSTFPSVVSTGLGLNGIVWDLFEYDGSLIVGGEFTIAGPTTANHIAAFDGKTWSTFGSGTDGRVFTFAEYGGDLVAGGEFLGAGGQNVGHIARWDGSGWQDLNGGVSGPVHALVEYDGNLIVGGDFEYAGGVPAHKIARWDGSLWHSLGDGFSGGYNDLGVRSLEVFKDRLYAGGHFINSGATKVLYVARWNDESQSWEPVGTGLPGAGYALIADAKRGNGKRLYAGSVVWLPGTGGWEDVIREWPANWSPLGSGVLAEPFPNAGRAFAFRGGRLIAGGQFIVAAGEPVNFVAKWTGSNWESFGSGTNGPVFAVANFQGSLFVGGEFTVAGDKQSSHIARWDGPPDNAFEVFDLTAEPFESGTRLTWSLTDDTIRELAEIRVERNLRGGSYRGLSGTVLLPAPWMTFEDLGVAPSLERSYRLVLIPHSGSPTTTTPISIPGVVVGRREQGLDPLEPENDGTIRFTFRIADTNTPVRLRVYNVRGQLVREVLQGVYEPGVHTYRWSYKADTRMNARGVYIASYEAGSVRSTQKFVILKG